MAATASPFSTKLGTSPTNYDKEHITIYLDLLDAEADRADWMEASVTVLHVDPIHELARRILRLGDTTLSSSAFTV